MGFPTLLSRPFRASRRRHRVASRPPLRRSVCSASRRAASRRLTDRAPRGAQVARPSVRSRTCGTHGGAPRRRSSAVLSTVADVSIDALADRSDVLDYATYGSVREWPDRLSIRRPSRPSAGPVGQQLSCKECFDQFARFVELDVQRPRRMLPCRACVPTSSAARLVASTTQPPRVARRGVHAASR